MKHKILKVILIFATTIVIFSNYTVLEARTLNGGSLLSPDVMKYEGKTAPTSKDPLTNPGYYDSITNPTNDTALITMGGKVLGIINTIGVVASVIVLMILGIKYMVGSVEEKAEYKKSMLAYVIGAVMVFGITTIANIIYTIATTALK